MRISRNLILFAGMLMAADARAETCPPPRTTVPDRHVVLTTGIAEPVYGNDIDRSRLTALAVREGLSGGSRGHVNTGLTRSRVEARIALQMWEIDLGRGRRCVGLGRVDLHWTVDRLLVDIASDYRPGGCNYRVIREHEDEHVALSRETYSAWTPRVEAALKDAVTRVAPVVVNGDARRLPSETTQRLMQALQPVIEGFRADLKARNARIDTAPNYRLVNSRCPKW